jgi:hypothetical protein
MEDLDNYLSKVFYRSKRGGSRDIFIVYQDGCQDMVFKTMGNKSINSFHSEMVNWVKKDMVFKTMGSKQ